VAGAYLCPAGNGSAIEFCPETLAHRLRGIVEHPVVRSILSGASGGVAAVVAAAGRLGRPVDPAPGRGRPPTLVGYLTAGATPVWLLGSFAVLSLLYRAEVSADPATTAANASTEQAPVSAKVQPPGAEVLTKRAQAERAYATLSATGAPVSAGQLAAAAGLSASYARALVAQFQARPPTALQHNGRRPAAADADPEATS
jgi:hypothetical protein